MTLNDESSSSFWVQNVFFTMLFKYHIINELFEKSFWTSKQTSGVEPCLKKTFTQKHVALKLKFTQLIYLVFFVSPNWAYDFEMEELVDSQASSLSGNRWKVALGFG